MQRVVVTGIGLVSALGDRRATWAALLAGRSAIRLQQPFAALPPRPLAMVGDHPAPLMTLVDQALAEAWQDAGLADGPDPTLDRDRLGVCVGSSRSAQGAIEQIALGQVLLDATWVDRLPNSPAVRVAQQVGARGPLLAPMTACTTGISAIARGADLIREGWCDRVIAGAVESPITPLTLAGFGQMGALAQTGAYPFDRAREGLVLGEGAAILVLERADLAQARGAQVYGVVGGAGFSTDAHHLSAPAPAGRAARIAVKQAIERSGWEAAMVDYIHAHGTATALNDRQEAALIADLFPPTVAVSSSKGATGHTLGASGALGVAFCLLALRSQQVPPCVGLRDPEFAGAWVRSASTMRVDRALCLGFGFGGQNAAIGLERSV
jgi:3-oxoacyl-[acyl-carrier-protein] synthase II